jgi:hypothetical protein
MDNASVARFLSESLDDVYMRDPADHHKDSSISSPDLSFEIPDSQDPYVTSQSSHKQDYLYGSLGNQEDPTAVQAAHARQQGLLAARSHSCAANLDEPDSNSIQLCDTRLEEAYLEDADFDDCASIYTDDTEVIEGGTRLTERPEPRFVSPEALWLLNPVLQNIHD